jgi:hypothetical protein
MSATNDMAFTPFLAATSFDVHSREAQNQGGIAVLATRASGLPTHSAAWN